MKFCSTCKNLKPYDKFHSDCRSKDKKSYSCIDCAISRASVWYKSNKESYDKLKGWSRHLTKYWPGSTPEQALNLYESLVSKQNNLCKVCNTPEVFKDPRTNQIRKLSVDHCHRTGLVRGLLCNRCNKCIGQLDDSIEIVENIVKYLKTGLIAG